MNNSNEISNKLLLEIDKKMNEIETIFTQGKYFIDNQKINYIQKNIIDSMNILYTLKEYDSSNELIDELMHKLNLIDARFKVFCSKL